MVSGRRPPPSRWETLEIDYRPEQSRRTVSAIYPLPADTPTSTVPRVVERELAKSDRWFPWLVPLFVIANSVLFIITMYANDCPKKSVSCIAQFLGRFSFQPFKENPLLGPSSTTLQKMGALDVDKVVHSHEAWRLLSCNWLHAGVFHLLANMLSLLAIGIRLEQEFGFARVSVLYIVSGFGGSLMSSLFIQKNISVGASGSLFGLLGAMLSELITNWSIYVNKVATLSVLVIIIAINLSVGILPHVDNFAHIGGFLSGFLMGFVLLIRPQYGWRQSRVKSKYKAYQCVLWVISVALLVAWLTLTLVAILRGVNGNDHCGWCHYMSCVPTSKWTCSNQPATCLTTRSTNQLNVTCVANGRSHLYINTNVTDSQIQNICSLLCN